MLIFSQTQAGLRCIQIHQRSTGKQLIFQTDVLGATIAAVGQVAFGLLRMVFFLKQMLLLPL